MQPTRFVVLERPVLYSMRAVPEANGSAWRHRGAQCLFKERAERIGVTKAMFMLYRRPDMSGDEFRDYWRNTHGPIAAKMPGLKKYVQNQALMTEEGEPPVASIVEVYFDSVQAM